MNTTFEKNNIAHLTGTVTEEPKLSHVILGEGFYDLKLNVPRLSEQYDVIPVTISERLLNDIRIGDTLSLDGQFRSYNKLEEGKSKLILTFFAKEIVDFDETENTNTINITGYICKEPIYRTTPFGREICDVLIAVNRAYNKSDYIPCIAWGRNARFVRDLNIGDKISLMGRIQSRNYQKKVSEDHVEDKVAYEISISSISLSQDLDEVETI